jgi:NAD(P)-dependent dehydrogenase (short-subunit alcohol dehydrogenase family)
MKTLVVGATGTIGTAIVNLLSDKGHEVVQVTRNTEPGLNLDQPESIDAFYKAVGKVDAVICAAGNTSFGPLSELFDEQFRLGIDSKLLGQVNLVRKGLTSIRAGGAFILTGGITAYNPWPNTSNIAMVNAALEGFVRAAALDLQDTCRLIVVHPPVVREWAIQAGMDGNHFPKAATVAETYLMALESNITGQPVFCEGYLPT